MPFVSPYTLGLSHQILILLHLHCRHLLEQGEGEEMYSLLLLFYDGLSQALSWMPEAKRKGGGNLFSLASLDRSWELYAPLKYMHLRVSYHFSILEITILTTNKISMCTRFLENPTMLR